MATANNSRVRQSEHDVEQYDQYGDNAEDYSDYEEEEERDIDDKLDKGGDSSRAKPKNAELQAYFDVLGEQMALDKLHESMKRRDGEMLSQAIREFEDLGLNTSKKQSYQNLYQQALAVQTDVEEYRKHLREARRSARPDAKLLEDRLGAVKRIHIEPYLRDEVEKCRRLLEKLSVKERDTHILAMDKKTMAEMKSYIKPSPVVQRIMTSALLLLGEDEETTSNWTKVQSLCNPDGRNGMLRRMMNFDPAEVHPEISGRVRFLLKYITLADAKKASPGAGTFYVWSKRVIGEDPEEDERSAQGEEWDSRNYSTADSYDTARRGGADDDTVSGLGEDEEEVEYQRMVEQEDRKRKDEEYYKRTLPAWINKEKKIFSDRKKEKELQKRSVDVAQRSRPAGGQLQDSNKTSFASGRNYPGQTSRPKQSQQNSIRYM